MRIFKGFYHESFDGATSQALFSFLLSLFFLTTSRVKAQSTFGSIRGVAQDQSGATIPDVQVTLHNVDENVDRLMKTDATGAYPWRLEREYHYASRDGAVPDPNR